VEVSKILKNANKYVHTWTTSGKTHELCNMADKDYENYVVEVAQRSKTKKDSASFLENGC
jgi:hypothetical protein